MPEWRINLLSLTCSRHCREEKGGKKGSVVPKVARLTSESNGENKNSHILTALPDLSVLTGKRMKHCDNTSGESNKRFVLTLNYLLTTNRAVAAGKGLLPGRHTDRRLHVLYFQQHLPQLLQLPSLSACRLDSVPGPCALLGLTRPGEQGAFRGRSQVLIYKMAIFFFHNSMLLHYQILSGGQYLIPEVLDANERCFASGHWGLNQQG